MKKLKYSYKLDPEEKELLKSVESGEWEVLPDNEKEKRNLREAAVNTLKLRKSRNLNIRIWPATLAGLKNKAKKEGLPYQTLVSLLLNQYVNGKITLTL